MGLTRRGFLKLLASVAVTGVSIPVLSRGRDSYVKVGEVVDWIGYYGEGYIGGKLVHSIGDWDGVGYPVNVWNQSYGPKQALEVYYDYNLVNFRREAPDRFWTLPGSSKYPNIHSYIRTKRFGETIDQAARKVMCSYRNT